MSGWGQLHAQVLAGMGYFRGKPNGAHLRIDCEPLLSAPAPATWLTHAKSVLCKDMSSQGGDNMRNSSCFRAGFPISPSFEMSLLLIRHFHWKSSNCQQQFTQQGSVILYPNMVNGAVWKQIFRCLLDVWKDISSHDFSEMVLGFNFLGLRFYMN